PRGLGTPLHLAFLVVVLLLVVGARRLPEIGRSLGSGMREFKDSITGDSREQPTLTSGQPAQPKQPQQAQPAQPPQAPPAPPPAPQPPAEQAPAPAPEAPAPPARGSPAASAEVQPSWRSALLRRLNTAPEPARQPRPERCAAYSSKSLQVPRCSTSTWRSPSAPAPSTGARAGTG